MNEVYSSVTRDYPNTKAWADHAPYLIPEIKADAEAQCGHPLRTVSVSHTVHLSPDGRVGVTYLIVLAKL